MAEPTPPPPPPPPVQPPSVVFRCRQCDRYCEFESHHPDTVVCPRCGREDLVNAAIEFSEIIQRIRQQRRFMVDRDLTQTFRDNREAQNMPASKASVAALEEVVVTEKELCPVCKMDMGVGDMATRMPCKHLFHGDCISDWFKYGNTCPVCRFGLPKDDKAAMGGRREPGPDNGGSDAAVAQINDTPISNTASRYIQSVQRQIQQFTGVGRPNFVQMWPEIQESMGALIEAVNVGDVTDCDLREMEEASRNLLRHLQESAAAEAAVTENDWPPPASKAAVAALEEVAVEEEVQCPVCRENERARRDATMRRMPCTHAFHGECILTWLARRNTCPVCRFGLPTDDEDYEAERMGKERGLDGPDDAAA
ncbi:E3 ubiquitin-protein ligase RING1-like [Acorus gramineus]|uniref:E3 ubiquitin-protein ligase RING1-like n=1 Tax=Acorus gramineus TaxID=55184 RepID=A0AAV9BDX3_ACOGR|nr:E3 ubiquitin-protein ligase RING1-like [Acorus gramineus]